MSYNRYIKKSWLKWLGHLASKLPGHLIGEVSPTPEVPWQTQDMLVRLHLLASLETPLLLPQPSPR